MLDADREVQILFIKYVKFYVVIYSNMLNNLSAREGIENQDSSYWLVFIYGLKYTQDRGRKYRRKSC